MMKAMTRVDSSEVEIIPPGVLDLEEADAFFSRICGNTVVIDSAEISKNGDRVYKNMRVFSANGERMRVEELRNSEEGITVKNMIVDNLTDGIPSGVIRAVQHGAGVDSFEEVFDRDPEELTQEES